MSVELQLKNRVKLWRLERGWSQETLAERAGISRTAVSAIEGHRLVPSVAAALALAQAFGCTVEELFGIGASQPAEPQWAWPPPNSPSRYWEAEVAGRALRYPVEATPLGVIPHDGVVQADDIKPSRDFDRVATIVMASCDPAANLLATELARSSSLRLLVFPRSSHRALELLEAGLVHVAGIHLSTQDEPGSNADAARTMLGDSCRLVRAAHWQEGVAFSSRCTISSVKAAVSSTLSWVGREPGSGARHCLDQLLQGRQRPRRIAHDHRGVAEAVRNGWADAGVCHKLVSEEAGLRFLPVREEAFDLCFTTSSENDPRIQALLKVVRSAEYRRTLGELPGYDSSETGDEQPTS